MQIFISYSSKNRALVDSLVSDLESLGHKVWLDKELSGGQLWWDVILKAIRECDLFVIAVTPQSLDSYPCKLEREYAQAINKRILPLSLLAFNANLLPPDLAQLQIVDYQNSRSKNAAVKLSRAMNLLSPATAMPDPLPAPPKAPVSPLGHLKEMIESPTLDRSDQAAVVLDLKGFLENPKTRGIAQQLLLMFRGRDDLFDRIADELDDLIKRYRVESSRRRSILLSALLGGAVIVLLFISFQVILPALQKPTPTNTITPTQIVALPTHTQTLLPATATNALTATLVTLSPTLPPTATATETASNTLQTVDVPMTPTVFNTKEPSTPGLLSTRSDSKGVTQVWVPGGIFAMGSVDGRPDEIPYHEVSINSGFWLDETEVTNASYAKFTDDPGGYNNEQFWDPTGWQWKKSNGGVQNYDFFSDANQPRVGVSWYEAQAYAKWRGCRLPTEAEWEYAARGTVFRQYPWGGDWIPGNANANNVYNKTTPVKNFPSGVSWVGAYDMAGNVWEWVYDVYDKDFYSSSASRFDPVRTKSPTESETADRVARGGSYLNDFVNSRTAYRGHYPPTYRRNFVGFRVACSQ